MQNGGSKTGVRVHFPWFDFLGEVAIHGRASSKENSNLGAYT